MVKPVLDAMARGCAVAAAWLTLCAALAHGQSGLAPADDAAPTYDPVYFDDWDNAQVPASFASALAQPANEGLPAAATTASQPRRPTTSTRPLNNRLASVPNMFGDFGMLSASAVVFDGSSMDSFEGEVGIPAAGGSRRVKVGENNKALPDDRVFFSYNHFHNAFELDREPLFGGPAVTRQDHLDRYTFGIEKKFLDDQWSLEMRMPFNGSYDLQLPNMSVDGGNVGNLALVAKRLLYMDDSMSIVAGLGIDLPTGNGVDLTLSDTNYRLENDAVHLLPYFGFLVLPNEMTFFTAFVQVDAAANGNEVLFDTGAGRQSAGFLTEQNLLFVDVSLGRYLWRDPNAYRLTGVAALLEVHYTSALQDTDFIAIDTFAGGTQTQFLNPLNRFDIVNLTAGFNFDLFNLSSLRVAGVFPVRGEDNRFFDAEVQVQFNRRF